MSRLSGGKRTGLVQVESEERQLDNGLRAVLAPDRTTPVVAVNLWYAVGSRNERAGKIGRMRGNG